MFFRLSKLALVVALACSLGLHWGFMQSVAWVSMVVSYSQDAALKEAVAKTFDGNHPCALCKHIAKGRQAEKKSESPPAGKQFEFSYSATAFLLMAPSDYWEMRCPEDIGPVLPRTPPVPPPRQLPG